MDLFARVEPACGDCQHYGNPINPGVAYCHGEMTWRRADDRVIGCIYRDRTINRQTHDGMSHVEAIRDLLESPRHSIDAKGRAWLRAQLRLATPSSQTEAAAPSRPTSDGGGA